MATTIITKNGSGAPLAGDLTAGELAVDLTNKRLYSKDSGGTVIELGTTPSAISGGTIDNTVIGGTTAAAGTFTDLTATSSFTSVGIDDNASSTAITIDSSQNVSLSGDLTVDTNTLYVDSTNNRVGIGTDSADELLEISSATGSTSIDPTVVRISTTTNAGTWTSDATWGALQFYNADTSDGGAKVHAQIAANTTSTTGGVSDIVFSSAAVTTGTLTERMRIDSDGNVGIGETSPEYLLDLKGGTNDSIRLNALSGSFIFANGSGADKGSFSMNGGNMNIAADAGIDFYSGGSPLSGDPQVTLDSSGNVGIGTNAPADKLHVKTASNGGGIRIQRDSVTQSDYAELGFLASTTDSGTPSAWMRGYRGASSGQEFLTLGTSNTERMRIDSSGDLLVGNTLGPLGLISTTTTEGFGIDASETYVAISRSNNGSALYLNKPGESTATAGDFIQCRQNGTNVGEIDYDGADLVITQASDERLKNNIADSASAGSIIDAMQVRSFDWNNGVHVDYGFVAQELHQAYEPAAKVGGDDVDEEPWGIKTQKLIPLLVKEIQDLRARVAQLEGAS